MRSKVAKILRETFARKLQEELPQFQRVDTESIRAGDRLFSWRRRPDLTCYIYLFISPKPNQDRFAVELACSPGEFPFAQMPREPSYCRNGTVRFRLPQLYKSEWPKTNWEPMWEVGPHENAAAAIQRITQRALARQLPSKDEGLLPVEEALRFVEPAVEDAITRIRKCGIPFFDKFAETRIGLPTTR